VRPHLVPRLSLASSVLFVLVLSPGCRSKGPDSSTGDRVVSSWAYPVRLGQSRAVVHELLGNPSRVTDTLEEYAISGVTVWYSPEGRVAKLNFLGDASALYSSGSFDSIPSDRQLMFGLTAHTDQAGFRRLLGVPVREAEVGRADAKETRVVWRKDGAVVDALFLAADRRHDGRILPRGTLVWFEVSPGP
jgi:hypothetical protein